MLYKILIQNKNPYKIRVHFLNGGAGEIRTLAPVAQSTPLAGAPLQPLEYCSKTNIIINYFFKFVKEYYKISNNTPFSWLLTFIL